MKIAGEGRSAAESAPGAPSRHSACSDCGAPLAEDQEWCLECGAAKTLIHRPPDWRIPIAIIGAVVLLILAALAILLISLSSNANAA